MDLSAARLWLTAGPKRPKSGAPSSFASERARDHILRHLDVTGMPGGNTAAWVAIPVAGYCIDRSGASPESGQIIACFIESDPAWVESALDECECAEVGSVKVGVLLCTELFFNERARAYGKAGADVIVTPRASGTSHHRWKTAGSLAAIVSGACFVSSNRYGSAPLGQTFGGGGFAMTSEGHQVGETSEQATLEVVTVDLRVTREQKRKYPCYVREL
jgi:hypothetical protein